MLLFNLFCLLSNIVYVGLMFCYAFDILICDNHFIPMLLYILSKYGLIVHWHYYVTHNIKFNLKFIMGTIDVCFVTNILYLLYSIHQLQYGLMDRVIFVGTTAQFIMYIFIIIYIFRFITEGKYYNE